MAPTEQRAETIALHHCCLGPSMAPGAIRVCRILMADPEDLP